VKNYLSFEEAVRWIAHCKGRPQEHDDNLLDLIKLLEKGLVTATGRKAGSPTTEFVAIDPVIWADTIEEGKEWSEYSGGDERSPQLYHCLSLVGWPNHGASTGVHAERFAHREMDLPGTLTINTHHGAILTAGPTFTGLRIHSDELEAAVSEEVEAYKAGKAEVDPLREPFWNLSMVVAWVMFRDPGKVANFHKQKDSDGQVMSLYAASARLLGKEIIPFENAVAGEIFEQAKHGNLRIDAYWPDGERETIPAYAFVRMEVPWNSLVSLTQVASVPIGNIKYHDPILERVQVMELWPALEGQTLDIEEAHSVELGDEKLPPPLQRDILKAYDDLKAEGKLATSPGDRDKAIIARLEERRCHAPSKKTIRRALKDFRP
jgi:hypothetical protein